MENHNADIENTEKTVGLDGKNLSLGFWPSIDCRWNGSAQAIVVSFRKIKRVLLKPTARPTAALRGRNDACGTRNPHVHCDHYVFCA